jgi:hypothetical protein
MLAGIAKNSAQTAKIKIMHIKIDIYVLPFVHERGV